MTDLYKFQQDTYDSCQRLLERSGLSRVQFSDLLKEFYEDAPDLKEFLEQFDPFSWYGKLFSFKTEKDVLVWFKGCGGVINSMKKYNDDKKLREKEEKWEEKIEQLKKKNEQDQKHLKEESERNSQDLKDIGDEIKRQKEAEKKIIDEITRKKNNPDKPKDESFDEECKREYTEETERKLREKNISDAQLSQKLGVSDWKAEMNKSSGWRTAQTFSFSINKAIDKIENEIVCDYCKETKSSSLGKHAYEIPSKKKKFCSYDCKSTWEEENKEGNKKDDSSTNRKSEFKDFSIGDFFSLMKKLGVKKFWYDFEVDQVMLEFNNGNRKQLKEVNSELSSEQQESLTKQLKSSSKPITFSEIDRELNRKGKKDDKGNAGIIAAVLVVGLILAVIIGVVIGKRKKKDY